MLCINSSISSRRMGMPAIEPMPRINPSKSARNFRLMDNDPPEFPGATQTCCKRIRAHRAGGVSRDELLLAAHTFISLHREFSVSYATGGDLEGNRVRQGDGCTEQLSVSRCSGPATRAIEKRKSGTKRMENTPQTGSSPASNTSARHTDTSDLREKNIIKLAARTIQQAAQ